MSCCLPLQEVLNLTQELVNQQEGEENGGQPGTSTNTSHDQYAEDTGSSKVAASADAADIRWSVGDQCQALFSDDQT